MSPSPRQCKGLVSSRAAQELEFVAFSSHHSRLEQTGKNLRGQIYPWFRTVETDGVIRGMTLASCLEMKGN